MKLNIYKLLILTVVFAPIFAAQQAPMFSANANNLLDDIVEGNIGKVVSHLEEFPNDINFTNSNNATTLMIAMKSDSLPMIREILKRTKTEKINLVDKDGNTVMFYFDYISTNEPMIAMFLMQKGARLDIANRKKFTPLMYAAYKGFYRLVISYLHSQFYLENKNMINYKDHEGLTAFDWVIKSSIPLKLKLTIANYLLNHSANIKNVFNNRQTSLFQAIEDIDLDIAKFLIDNKIDINNYIIFDSEANINLKHFTPLLYAIFLRNYLQLSASGAQKLYDIIELLINNGASLEATPIYSMHGSPLKYAIICGDFDVVKLLILRGADLHEIVHGLSMLEIAEDRFNKEKNALKKEVFLKIVNYLKDPLNYLNDELNALKINDSLTRANDLLMYRYSFPEDVADIVSSYVTGPTRPSEIEHNKKLVALNKIQEFINLDKEIDLTNFLNEYPDVLCLKNDDNETPLIYAVKKNKLMMVVVILEKITECFRSDLKQFLKEAYYYVPNKESDLANLLKQYYKSFCKL